MCAAAAAAGQCCARGDKQSRVSSRHRRDQVGQFWAGASVGDGGDFRSRESTVLTEQVATNWANFSFVQREARLRAQH